MSNVMNKPTVSECVAVLGLYKGDTHEPESKESRLVELSLDRLLELFMGIDMSEESVNILRLGKRAGDCLRTRKIYTLGQLTELSLEDLSQMRKVGAVSVREIIHKLASIGMKLSDTPKSAKEAEK